MLSHHIYFEALCIVFLPFSLYLLAFKASTLHNGKTHLAIGLGIKACLAGYQVLFVTVPLLVSGYVTNKTLPFINARIHAKIQKKINTIFKEKRYLC